MKIKVLILAFVFNFSSVYAVVDIMPLSPYINRGVSIDLHLAYNPFRIVHIYEQEAGYGGYSAYANIIQFIKNDWERGEGFINFGLLEEKLELSIWVRPWWNSMNNIKTRVKYKHIEAGENKMFRNIALSSFAGWTFKRYKITRRGREMAVGHEGRASMPQISNIIIYGGTSLGTRKKIADFSYFEIFTNPHLAFTQYRGLGSCTYDPAKILGNPFVGCNRGECARSSGQHDTFSLWIPDFSMPIGIGFKYRGIALRTGTAITATIGGEARNLNRRGTITDKIVFDSHNFPKIPFFVEVSFDFGRFRKSEKEKS